MICRGIFSRKRSRLRGVRQQSLQCCARAPDEQAAEALSAAVKDESSTPLPYQEHMTASGPEKVFLIDDAYVKQMVASIVKDQDLSRYIL